METGTARIISFWTPLKWASALLLMVILAGCAHHNDIEIEGRGFTRIFTPQMPTLLIGPAAATLTNSTGFSARATIYGDPALQEEKAVEGELLCRGSKLLFAPRGVENAEKDSAAKGFIYVWDVATASGHIRSEALQAYAPVSTPLLITNVTETSLGGNAHEITVTTSDGVRSVFRAAMDSRATNVPTQLKSTSGVPLSVTLSKLRMQAPPEQIFALPSDFSKYPTAEALADELAARQHNLRRGGPLLPTTSSGGPEIIRH